MVRPLVYIASPYTVGDPTENVNRQIDAANELLSLGLVPVCPLLSHYIHMKHPHPYETWLQMDIALLSRCDCLLRLPGISSGADREVSYAVDNDIQVFYTINEIKQYYGL